MPTAAVEKIDLYKEHKAEYAATRDPQIVRVGHAKYLTIEGKGSPDGTTFMGSVGALYAMAYTIKMTEKFAGRDYKVCGLEGQWWVEDAKNWMDQSKESWQWKLMIRVPEFITQRHLNAALEQVIKKGKAEGADGVRLETISEGRCVQVLHVGPYSNEHETIGRMDEFMATHGLKRHGLHHEIYLSDPRRVPPERLRTILRHPVE